MGSLSVNEPEARYLVGEFVDVLHKQRGILKSRKTLSRWIAEGVRLPSGETLRLECEWIGNVRHLTLALWDRFHAAQQPIREPVAASEPAALA